MAKADIRAFERTRAANIVREYENELINRLRASPNANNAEKIKTIIRILARMRRDIMGSMQEYVAPIKRGAGNDFSLEEIEAALEFVEDKA